MARLRWQIAEEIPQGTLFPDGDEVLERRPGEGQFEGLEFLHVKARRVINEVPPASRMPFRFTINAYRGCSHACVYCFARPSHEYLGLNSGEDFERRIVVKINALECLRGELSSPRWRGEHIAMGTNTDPYQRCEGKYRLTRGIIETLGQAGNPFSLLTKSTLILRDLDVLSEASSRTSVRANVSIATLDEEVWIATEPGTPHPRRRVEAVARLNEAGIPCGVLVAPVLPSLSDRPEQLKAVVEACLEAKAVSVSPLLLHLRPGVKEHFLAWLGRTYPELLGSYERLYPGSYVAENVQAKVAQQVQDHGLGRATSEAAPAPSGRPTGGSARDETSASTAQRGPTRKGGSLNQPSHQGQAGHGPSYLDSQLDLGI